LVQGGRVSARARGRADDAGTVGRAACDVARLPGTGRRGRAAGGAAVHRAAVCVRHGGGGGVRALPRPLPGAKHLLRSRPGRDGDCCDRVLQARPLDEQERSASVGHCRHRLRHDRDLRQRDRLALPGCRLLRRHLLRRWTATVAGRCRALALATRDGKGLRLDRRSRVARRTRTLLCEGERTDIRFGPRGRTVPAPGT
jgi:hypothetical protein